MNVSLVEYYVPGCGVCIGIVENIVASAVRDVTVSHTKLVAGVRHCHELEAATKTGNLAAGAATANTPAAAIPSGVLFTENEVAGLRISCGQPPNGFDSDGGHHN